MLEKASLMAARWQGPWLRSGLVKLFLDGVIENGTAWVLEPYPDAPGQHGTPLFAPDRFAEIAVEADRRGLQVAVHAIGDAAVRAVIDGYAAAQTAHGRRDSRHRIEHIELIHPADVPRLRQFGITASLQPAHVPGALDIPVQPTAGRISVARWGDAFACRRLDTALAFGSDWPIADASVLRGIGAAVTRGLWAAGLPDESIGLMPTLAAYTRGGAWAAHAEGWTGMLRAGHMADLVVLDGDIEAAAPARIGKMAVVLTLCGGCITYERAN